MKRKKKIKFKPINHWDTIEWAFVEINDDNFWLKIIANLKDLMNRTKTEIGFQLSGFQLIG